MKSRIIVGVIALIFAVFPATTASNAAENTENTEFDLKRIRAILDSQNISYYVYTDKILTHDGLIIQLSNCNPTITPTCVEIQFSRTFGNVRPTLEAVNRWNSEKKIPEASVTSDGVLHMEMWLSTFGLTDTNFFSSIVWFESSWPDEVFWKPYIKSSGS